ncbi:hypothetical protein J6590_022465 [Homalodisca vitripennis]|nr:hypothetical protein J6590_022465 [Homalodisca vitripennis]
MVGATRFGILGQPEKQNNHPSQGTLSPHALFPSQCSHRRWEAVVDTLGETDSLVAVLLYLVHVSQSSPSVVINGGKVSMELNGVSLSDVLML